VCVLGACDRLVGVDDYSDWPQAVRALPRMGGLHDVRIERIVSLRPDVVLLSSTSPALARLQRLGVTVVSVELKSLADARRAMDTVARVLHLGDGAAAWARVETGISAAMRTLPPAAHGTTVYFEVGTGPYAASESSHIGQLLARLGMANVVPADLGSVPKLNPEFVVRADPQVIMLSEHNPQPLAQRPGWSGIRAVREGRVCHFSPTQGDVIVRPGPRLDVAAQLLADCIAGRLGKVTP